MIPLSSVTLTTPTWISSGCAVHAWALIPVDNIGFTINTLWIALVALVKEHTNLMVAEPLGTVKVILSYFQVALSCPPLILV